MDVLRASALEIVVVQQDSGIAIGDLPGLLKDLWKLSISPFHVVSVVSMYLNCLC